MKRLLLEMKKLSALFLGLICLACMSFTNLPADDINCKILHKGTFVYGNTSEKITVVIKGSKHTEYYENGKYIIKSKLVWVSNCEYNMTMTQITIPNFPYKVGDVMNVKITKVVGNQIYYTSTVKGNTWDGELLKVKD
jgi:hypothetical protein